MILSTVMQSAWAEVIWPSLPSVSSPVTFLKVVASVLGLAHLLVPRCLPPDKAGPLALPFILQLLALERERCYDWMVNCLLPAGDSPAPTTPSMSCSSNACDSPLDFFKITIGCSSHILSALNKWSNFHTHVSNIGLLNSFGPIGLLSALSLFKAAVDTVFSLLVSPHQANLS